MAKYNYEKKGLKGLSVGPFLGEVKTRNAEIEKAPDTLPEFSFNTNDIAEKLHPSFQIVKITQVKEQCGAKTFTMEPCIEKGTKELAYFRAGEYISVALDIGQAKLCKPYSLCSSPLDAKGAKNNKYAITVKATENGFASKYILENWQVGTEAVISAPLGQFYYVGLRDKKNVIALAGGSGITPFLSMARAIADGLEDFSLTILYGSRTGDAILLREELEEAAARSNGKVKVVHVLSDDTAEGYEHGYITADLISKYTQGEDYSVFVCGPKAMYAFEEKQIEKLALPRRRVRFELSGEFGLPTNDPAYDDRFLDKEFKVTVWVRGEKTELTCKAEQTLMSAVENAGIRVPSDCRSGQCGWCHSRLISGEVFVPEAADGRRAADKKFGWVHPCVTYPLSDVEMEVFPMME